MCLTIQYPLYLIEPLLPPEVERPDPSGDDGEQAAAGLRRIRVADVDRATDRARPGGQGTTQTYDVYKMFCLPQQFVIHATYFIFTIPSFKTSYVQCSARQS